MKTVAGGAGNGGRGELDGEPRFLQAYGAIGVKCGGMLPRADQTNVNYRGGRIRKNFGVEPKI
jgi:hypothetical protein